MMVAGMEGRRLNRRISIARGGLAYSFSLYRKTANASAEHTGGNVANNGRLFSYRGKEHTSDGNAA